MFIFCLNLKGGGYTICAINEIYQQLTGTRVQEAMRQKKHAGNVTGLATTFEVHNQFRKSRTKLERDLQILRLIKTNLVVDVLGGYSLKGLSRLGKTASRRVLTNTQKTCCIYACFFVFVHFSAANALSIKAFWWHFSGKQFLFRENKNILR